MAFLATSQALHHSRPPVQVGLVDLSRRGIREFDISSPDECDNAQLLDLTYADFPSPPSSTPAEVGDGVGDNAAYYHIIEYGSPPARRWRGAMADCSSDLRRTDLGARVGGQQRTHEEVYRPNVDEYILTGMGSRPVVICVICQTNELVIDGLQPRRAGAEQEGCFTLACNHMVGASCWNKWVSIQRGGGRDVKCPICNHRCWM